MARQAKSLVTRTFTRWAVEVADNSVIQVSVWHQNDVATAEITYYGVETGWSQNQIDVTDSVAVALAVSLIKGQDTAAILADRIEEIGYSDFAYNLRRGNMVEVADIKKKATAAKAKARRDAMKNAMQSLGMRKVRGSMGGTYWE